MSVPSRWRSRNIESHRLGRSIDSNPAFLKLTRFPIAEFSTVNQAPRLVDCYSPRVTRRRNKSRHFIREEEEKIVGKQFLEKRSFAIIIIPVAKSPPETAVIFRPHCPKVRVPREILRLPDISRFPPVQNVRFSIFAAEASNQRERCSAWNCVRVSSLRFLKPYTRFMGDLNDCCL